MNRHIAIKVLLLQLFLALVGGCTIVGTLEDVKELAKKGVIP